MKPRATMWVKGHGTGVDYNIKVQFGAVTFIFPAEGKAHAIDIVAAINREEPKDEYGTPTQPPVG